MGGAHEAGQVEIAADVLDHHIGCGAPAADRDIAVRQGETRQRRLVSALHDFEIGDVFCVEPFARPVLDDLQIGFELRRIGCLPLWRLILQLAAQAGMIAGVDAEPGGPLRLVLEQIVCDFFQHELGAARLGRRCNTAVAKRDGRAPAKGDSGGDAKAGDGLAAGDLKL